MIMKRVLFYFPAMILLAGCDKFLPIDLEPHEPVQINFTQANLFPEGITYDTKRERFYVSSLTRGDIGSVSFDGTYKPFITDEILTGTTGLKIDKARQRLLVCNAPFDGPNGIGAYNLNTGARVFYTDLGKLLPDKPIFINDVALDPQGNAYVTNSFSPVIYKVDPEGKATVFFQDTAFNLPPGSFGFNGIQYDESGFLLVAFPSKLVKIPVQNPNTYSFVQLDAAIHPDGLLLSKDGKQLVLVDNTGGTTNDKVLSFISDDQWKSGSLSTSYNTGAVFPTTATSDGRRVFVLYAQLNKLLENQEQETFTIQEVRLKKKGMF